MEGLVAAVQRCTACDRMAHSHILSSLNGPVGARVLFVGEAPGRLGAGRTGVPFHGDESGRRFEAFLGTAGLSRGEVFVTNAVLCNPLSTEGNNRRPTTVELKRCLPFLRQQVEVVDPAVVVALGQVALSALSLIDGHGLSLRTDAGRPSAWFGRTLVPLYHPGRQSTLHRPDDAQRDDWRRLGEFLRRYRIVNETPRPFSGAAGVRQATK